MSDLELDLEAAPAPADDDDVCVHGRITPKRAEWLLEQGYREMLRVAHGSGHRTIVEVAIADMRQASLRARKPPPYAPAHRHVLHAIEKRARASTVLLEAVGAAGDGFDEGHVSEGAFCLLRAAFWARSRALEELHICELALHGPEVEPA